MYNVFAYKGYFVGTYPLRDPEGRYFGGAQICVELPADRLSANFVELVTSVAAYDTQERAVEAAQFQAKQIIDGMAPNWDPFTEPGKLSSS